MLVLVSIFTMSTYADRLTQTSVTTSRLVDTDKLEQAAKRWGLNVEEYQRYQDLMQGPLGRWNPQIDPVLALGIYAETPQEQQRYAEQFAQQEYELTVRTLAFERSYRAAFQKLFPQATVVDKTLLQPFYEHQQQSLQATIKPTLTQASQVPGRYSQLQPGDRLVYFPDKDCTHCGSFINRIYHQLLRSFNTVLDIYLRNVSDDQSIQQWAAKHQLNPSWSDGGKVTLNADKGLFERIQATTEKDIASHATRTDLYLYRNKRLYSIDKESLGL